MRIVIFGAGGNVGRRVVAEALGRGHDVTGGVRHTGTCARVGVRAAFVDMDIPATVALAAVGQDAAISAVAPGRGEDPTILVQTAQALVTELPRAGVTRLVVVGGAGSSQVAPGVRFVDSSQFPAALRPIGLAHAEALEVYQEKGASLEWTYVIPPGSVGPGERTGRYEVGPGAVTDGLWTSRFLSLGNLAMAIVGELERPRFIRRAVTVRPTDDTARIAAPFVEVSG